MRPGEIRWCEFDPVQGREQGGRRPALVISAAEYLDVVDTLAIVLPVTTSDRGWINHVRLSGDSSVDGYAMTEQPRTVTRDRLHGRLGTVDPTTLKRCTELVRAFLA